MFSRNHSGGVVCTQSGSFTPNLSKQATQAPSLQDGDVYEDNRLDVDSTFHEGLGPVARQPSHGRTVSTKQGTLESIGAGLFNDSAQISRGHVHSSENPSIMSVKLQIKNPRNELVTAAMSDERSAGEITGVGKVASQGLQAL